MIDAQKRQFIDQKHARRVYIVLSILSVMIMVIAAYITYGYQERSVTVTLATPEEPSNAHAASALPIGADLSRIPSDTEINRILNKYLPNVCDECDDDSLDCLDKYEINKVLVQEKKYQDQLFIELLTGKEPKKYTIVIDLLQNNAVLNASGSIDKKECITEEDEESAEGDEVMLNDGDDPNSTMYLKR